MKDETKGMLRRAMEESNPYETMTLEEFRKMVMDIVNSNEGIKRNPEAWDFPAYKNAKEITKEEMDKCIEENLKLWDKVRPRLKDHLNDVIVTTVPPWKDERYEDNLR